MPISTRGVTIANVVSNSTTAYVSSVFDGKWTTGGCLVYTATKVSAAGNLTIYIDGSNDNSNWIVDNQSSALSATTTGGTLLQKRRWPFIRIRAVAATADGSNYWTFSNTTFSDIWSQSPYVGRNQVSFFGGTIAAPATNQIIVASTDGKGHRFDQRVAITGVECTGSSTGTPGGITLATWVNAVRDTTGTCLVTLANGACRGSTGCEIVLEADDDLGVLATNSSSDYALTNCMVTITYEPRP